MANKKIDNLFQEQLKNLEVSPNKRVWNNIETQLSKKKRRVFPFWWFTGSIASILVLLLLFYPLSADENQNINNNSNEIITTIPEKNIIIINKIDSLYKNETIKKNSLLSKNNAVLKISKKSGSFLVLTEKEEFNQTKKTVKSIQIKHNPIVINFNTLRQHIALNSRAQKKPIKNLQKQNIEEVLKKEEEPVIKKTTKNWSVASVFAVLKSNSLTDTSPINASLAASTSGENSYTYGVQIAYKLNNKWSIRSGIQLQEMRYSNNQISVNTSSSLNPFATKFSNGASFSFSNTFINESAILDNNSFAASTINSTGNVAQNYGYIEIPVEVKYNFSNDIRFAYQIVTGFSTLFLNKNEVILTTQNFSRNLEATNLNNINFSGNLGFDFNYFLNTKWSFNVNPMVKVQLNTFSDNANGFAPFNFGLYTGLKYQF
jgi:hypothetical protein